MKVKRKDKKFENIICCCCFKSNEVGITDKAVQLFSI